MFSLIYWRAFEIEIQMKAIIDDGRLGNFLTDDTLVGSSSIDADHLDTCMPSGLWLKPQRRAPGPPSTTYPSKSYEALMFRIFTLLRHRDLDGRVTSIHLTSSKPDGGLVIIGQARSKYT